MATWSEILKQVNEVNQQLPRGASTSPFDIVRRHYLKALQAHTQNAIILYSTKWTQGDGNVSGTLTSVTPEDMQGMMEVIHGIEQPNLDLILHSPGGSAEAAESLMNYLRSKFKGTIRVFVPHAAMSAATMMACAADQIVLGKHSFLGPIDPQLIIHSQQGVSVSPAQAIIEQFEMAKDQVATDPSLIRVWMPMLQQYGPALLVQCKNHTKLAHELVSKWLQQYMFKGVDGGDKKAEEIAAWLSSHGEWKTHSRFIPREVLKSKGLNILDLEDDQDLQDLVLSVFHATTITFDNTNAVKIIENHLGRAFIKAQKQAIAVPEAFLRKLVPSPLAEDSPPDEQADPEA